MQRRHFTMALTGAALAAVLPRLHAQTWPERPVRWILSQPPGSGPDTVARILTEQLAKMWNQPVVVDNKPGGQNVVGAQAAAAAAPDGYTFYFATSAALITNPLMFKTLAYDPVKDFVPVSFVARSPFAVMVRDDSPVKSIEDLVARSKAEPGKFTIGNEGPRTLGGMIARLLNARAQANANLVPFTSVAMGTQNLLGGHVDALITGLASVAQLVRQGRMRVLATTSEKRVTGWESVPALSETLPGFVMEGWQAVVAPTGTPADAIARFNRDLNQVLSDKDVADRIGAIGPEVDPSMDVNAVGAFLRKEMTLWQEIVKEIGILPE